MGSSQRDGTSAADAMVEKILFQKILKNLRLFVKNHSCIATFRPLPGSQQLPLVLQTTPLAPQVPPGSTPIDGGGILLFLDFRHASCEGKCSKPQRSNLRTLPLAVSQSARRGRKSWYLFLMWMWVSLSLRPPVPGFSTVIITLNFHT